MPGPITPDEVVAHKAAVVIPEKVFDAFNELIAQHWNGRDATFKKNDVVDLILAKYAESESVTMNSIYGNNWLDVEPIYREAGWDVVYDRPGYNESYDAKYIFKRAS